MKRIVNADRPMKLRWYGADRVKRKVVLAKGRNEIEQSDLDAAQADPVRAPLFAERGPLHVEPLPEPVAVKAQAPVAPPAKAPAVEPATVPETPAAKAEAKVTEKGPAKGK